MLVLACDNAEPPPQKAEPQYTPPPIVEEPTIGYNAFVFACTSDGETEGVCKCQAQILSRQLPDDKIMLLAQAGAAASQGDVSQIDNIIENHPDILYAMKSLSVETEICAAAR